MYRIGGETVRKTVMAILLMLCMILSCSAGCAENIFLETEAGENGYVTYPVVNDENQNEWLQTRLHIADALILLRGGAEITGETATEAIITEIFEKFCVGK